MGEDASYGMGLFLDTQYGITIVSYGGDMLGLHSNMIWLPEYGIGTTILTNSDAGVLLRGPLLRKLLEVVFDGLPEADERIKVAVASRQTQAAKTREMLSLPVPANAVKNLAARYTSPELGALQVQRQGARLRLEFTH